MYVIKESFPQLIKSILSELDFSEHSGISRETNLALFRDFFNALLIDSLRFE